MKGFLWSMMFCLYFSSFGVCVCLVGGLYVHECVLVCEPTLEGFGALYSMALSLIP